jgi:type IX secretion system substrate protein
LPVELSAFTAMRSGQSSYLQWTTLTEHKSSYFEVERSGNGIDFEPVANIKSKAPGGNCTTVLKYSCYDNYPLWGINYYRLKQVDVDGRAQYHPIISLNQDQEIDRNNFLVYPNPSIGDVFMDITNTDIKDMTFDLSLLDVSGRQIGHASINDLTATEKIQLFRNLPKGYYILNVKTGYKDFNIKLTVN